jgi:hypothetical protein
MADNSGTGINAGAGIYTKAIADDVIRADKNKPAKKDRQA